MAKRLSPRSSERGFSASPANSNSTLALVLAIGVTLGILGAISALIGVAFDDKGYTICNLFYFVTAVCWGWVIALATATVLWWVWVRAL